MPGNGICRDPRAPLGIPKPTAEPLRKAVEDTDIYISSRPTPYRLYSKYLRYIKSTPPMLYQ